MSWDINNQEQPEMSLEDFTAVVTSYNQLNHTRERDHARERERVNFMLDLNRPNPTVMDIPGAGAMLGNSILLDPDDRHRNLIPSMATL